jgi:hypothetical protein
MGRGATTIKRAKHEAFEERRDKGEWFKLTMNDIWHAFDSFEFILVNKSLKDFLAN